MRGVCSINRFNKTLNERSDFNYQRQSTFSLADSNQNSNKEKKNGGKEGFALCSQREQLDLENHVVFRSNNTRYAE